MELVQAASTKSSWARCSPSVIAGSRSRLSIGEPLGCRCVPWKTPGRNAAPQLAAWPLGRPRPRGSLITTKPGQILALAPQAVSHPRADAGKPHPRHAGVHHEQGRRVVVRLGVARVNERHLVDVLAQVRENLRDHLAALAPRAEPERRLHQSADGVLEEPGRVLETTGRTPFIDLPSHRARAGLVVPGVDVARARRSRRTR